MGRVTAVYALSVALFITALALILHAGGDSSGVPITAGRSLAERVVDGLHDPVSQVLMQIVLIVGLARIVGSLFRLVGQPAVVGEMFAGIALGPSLLGSLAPGFTQFVFPASSLANLSTLSQFGVLLFMFGVGLELDTKKLREMAHLAIVVSHVSIFVPFALGAMAALGLYDTYRGHNTTFLAFALFMGISMSITAFPVLARIIQERGLLGTRIGSTVLTSAAVDDATAWSALAIIVALARAHYPIRAAWTILLAICFIGFALIVARPLLHRLVSQQGKPSASASALVYCLLCAFTFALVTEAIGLHAFFGAFFAGVVMPKDPGFRRLLHERLYSLSAHVLVPIFFAFTGLRTQIGLLHSASDWIVCAQILALAVLGKFGGSMVAAKVTGLGWRESAGIGALMNTRGLVELIALNVGLDLGVLSPKIFAMLVIMALATTVMTGPVLSLLKLDRSQEAEKEQAPIIEPVGANA